MFDISDGKALSSPIKANIFIMRFLGMWSTDDKYTNKLYHLYALTLAVGIGFGHTIFQIINFASIYHDFPLLASSLYVVLSCIAGLFKHTFVTRNLCLIKRIIFRLESEALQPKSGSRLEIMQKFIDRWTLILKVFLILTVGTLALWAVFPIIDKESREQKRLPFISWYPFDEKKSPYFEFCYIYQNLAVNFLAGSNVVVDTLLAALMMYTAGLCAVLCDDLRNIYKYSKIDLENHGFITKNTFDEIAHKLIVKNMNKIFIQQICYHQNILEFVRDAYNFVDPISFGQFGCSTFTICLTMFQLISVVPLSSEFFSLLFFQVGVFVQILLYCWFGNEVILESNKIPYAIYESEWIETPLEFKKNMLFFICRTQKPIEFRAMRFFTLSLETFTKIIRSSWSYFALIRQTVKDN